MGKNNSDSKKVSILDTLKRVDDNKAISELINKRLLTIKKKQNDEKKRTFKQLKVSQYWSVIKIVFRTCKFFNDLKDF